MQYIVTAKETQNNHFKDSGKPVKELSESLLSEFSNEREIGILSAPTKSFTVIRLPRDFL